METIFSDIYRKKTWRSNSQLDFDSGPGSDEPYAKKYAQVIIDFIKKHQIKTVLSLGCGDFRVDQFIATNSEININYIGVDVVKDLIDYNKEKWGNDNIHFFQADITQDFLPEADLVLVRQVFQHLSHQDIFKSLKNISRYPYKIFTDGCLLNATPINIDKPTNATSYKSYPGCQGLWLEQPPFNLKINILLTVLRKHEVIKTILADYNDTDLLIRV